MFTVFTLLSWAAATASGVPWLDSPCDINVTGTPPESASSMGLYALQPANTTGGRPAYLDLSNKQWLFFNGAHHWAIGPDLGVYESSYLYVYDSAQTPDAISATWEEPAGKVPSVKASCAPKDIFK
jgi:hypothetical protein